MWALTEVVGPWSMACLASRKDQNQKKVTIEESVRECVNKDCLARMPVCRFVGSGRVSRHAKAM